MRVDGRSLLLFILVLVAAACAMPGSDEVETPASARSEPTIGGGDAIEAITAWSLPEVSRFTEGSEAVAVAPLYWHGDGRVSVCASLPSADDEQWCGRPSAEIFGSHDVAVANGVRAPLGEWARDRHLRQLALVHATVWDAGLHVDDVEVLAPDAYPVDRPMTTSAVMAVPVGVEVVALGALYGGSDGRVLLCSGLGESTPPSCGGPIVTLDAKEGLLAVLDRQRRNGGPSGPWWVDGTVVVSGMTTATGIDVETLTAS